MRDGDAAAAGRGFCWEPDGGPGPVRVLAAVGPLDLPALVGTITRSRRGPEPLVGQRSRRRVDSGRVHPLDRGGRWRPPVGVVAPDRYRVIVTLAAGRELTRAEMITILLAAGYRESSATGRMSSSHPLFRRTGPDRYRLIS